MDEGGTVRTSTIYIGVGKDTHVFQSVGCDSFHLQRVSRDAPRPHLALISTLSPSVSFDRSINNCFCSIISAISIIFNPFNSWHNNY